jgi:ribA/ribD-fused uncharacterized protein
MKYTFFNSPDEENGILSFYYNNEFEINKQKFSNLYQYLIYQKALFYEDNIIAQKILNTKDYKLIKFYSNIIKENKKIFTNKIIQEILENGLNNQINQNKELLNFVINNNNFIYANCYDKILGIGFDSINAIYNKDKWGLNLYGKTLDIIKNNLANYNISVN